MGVDIPKSEKGKSKEKKARLTVCSGTTADEYEILTSTHNTVDDNHSEWIHRQRKKSRVCPITP